MESLEKVRQAVNGILLAQKDIALQGEGWVHLYGVSQAATLLACRRGLAAELCAVAGMLHDIYTFRTGVEKDHAMLGAPEAEKILRDSGNFDQCAVDTVVRMILRHSDKQVVDDPYEECLKDADVFAHWLYDSGKKFDKAKKNRLENVMNEIGIKGKIEEE